MKKKSLAVLIMVVMSASVITMTTKEAFIYSVQSYASDTQMSVTESQMNTDITVNFTEGGYSDKKVYTFTATENGKGNVTVNDILSDSDAIAYVYDTQKGQLGRTYINNCKTKDFDVIKGHTYQVSVSSYYRNSSTVIRFNFTPSSGSKINSDDTASNTIGIKSGMNTDITVNFTEGGYSDKKVYTFTATENGKGNVTVNDILSESDAIAYVYDTQKGQLGRTYINKNKTKDFDVIKGHTYQVSVSSYYRNSSTVIRFNFTPSSDGDSDETGLENKGYVEEAPSIYIKSIGKNNIRFKYTSSANTSKFEINYRKKGASNWKKKVTSKKSINLKGIKRKTNYQIRVRSIVTKDGIDYPGKWSNIMNVKTK